MEKNVMYRRPNHFAHTTSINHCQRNLGPPNTFPGEKIFLFASKDLIERSNIKLPFVRRSPPKLVFPFTSHSSPKQVIFELFT